MSRRSTTQRLDTARREATLARVDLCLAPRSRRPAPVARHVRWEPGVGRHRAGGARHDRRRRTQDDTRVTGERLLAGSARVRDPSLAIGDVHGAGLFSGRELAAGQLDDPTYLARMATLRTELAIAEEREPTHAVASADKVIAKLRALPETWAMATPDGRAELLNAIYERIVVGARVYFGPSDSGRMRDGLSLRGWATRTRRVECHARQAQSGRGHFRGDLIRDQRFAARPRVPVRPRRCGSRRSGVSMPRRDPRCQRMRTEI